MIDIRVPTAILNTFRAENHKFNLTSEHVETDFLVDSLEPKFKALMALVATDYACLPRPMPERGIYLFSEGEGHQRLPLLAVDRYDFSPGRWRIFGTFNIV